MIGWVARRRRDNGFTLVELLVSMTLLSVVSAITAAVFATLSHTQLRETDEAQGLQDVQTVVERLSRDLREARGVDASATQSQLTIWLDLNSDYVQTANETFTWKLQFNNSTQHYDVLRVDGNNVQVVEGRTLVSQLAFTYNATPVQNSNVVTVNMQYDAIRNGFATTKSAQFQVRMRNAA
jgi:prepilin-type N-terminal cleavage/methylation domain-containing protein